MSSKDKNNTPISDMDSADLVDIVRKKRNKNQEKINLAYNELIYRLRAKILNIVNQFFIPGFTKDDIYQEALIALRYKAIPDFKRNVQGRNGICTFDKFAVLCIRRHLSTKLKASFQNKKKALNGSISLDQDKDPQYTDNLFLGDILSTDIQSILEKFEDKEFYSILFSKLYKRLSVFEKKVFILYTKKYSYCKMTELINKDYKKKGNKKRIKVKSVDNALSRIKIKAKEMIDIISFD